METEYENLSEQTKLEMELGRKTAAANAAALALAEKQRAAETATEIDVVVEKMENKGYPVAKEPYQPKKPGK